MNATGEIPERNHGEANHGNNSAPICIYIIWTQCPEICTKLGLRPSIEETNCLEESLLLAELLPGVRDVCANAESVRSAAIQGKGERLASLAEERLDFGTASRRHEVVGLWALSAKDHGTNTDTEHSPAAATLAGPLMALISSSVSKLGCAANATSAPLPSARKRKE